MVASGARWASCCCCLPPRAPPRCKRPRQYCAPLALALAPALALALALALTLTKVSGAEEAERALHAQLTASHELAAQRAAALQAADQPYP